MDCYSCKYKRNEPGTAHKSCRAIKEHPLFNNLTLPQKGSLEILVAATGHLPLTTLDDQPLIQMDPHGVASGWCYWPADFDPTWIQACKFYTLRDDIIEFERI